MISIVMPVVDQHEYTKRSVAKAIETASTPNNVEILIIDNDSITPYVNTEYTRVIRNNVNPGVYASLEQGTRETSNNIVLWMHNDVMIHERDWDIRIEREFANDSKLGLGGFFGGRGVGMDGGRIHPEGNLLGKEWGQNISVHGHLLTKTHPAVVFDSLAMVFRKDVFYDIEVPYVAPHHWFDRIMTLWFVDKGYHALTIGIGFDHAGGGTSVANSRRHSEFVERWCRKMGLPLDQNWDNTLYQYGYAFFRNQWQGRFPVMVDRYYNVQWGDRYNDISDL